MGLLSSLFGGNNYDNITIDEYLAEYDGTDHVLIDVRSKDEFKTGHLPGARLIELNTLNDNLKRIPKDKPVVLVCATGNRSGFAAMSLVRAGYENVVNLRGGTKAWVRAGHTVER